MGMFRQLLGLQEAATTAEGKIAEGTVATLQYRLEESLAQLELARENTGWMKLSEQYQQEFSRDGLIKAAEMGRLFGIANPIIKRGREVRHAYVWGQGVTIAAVDQDVNDVVQAFIDDEGNREAFFGAQARQQYEGTLFDEGNFFLTHFTNPLTGRVKVRTIPFDEIQDVITAPGDKATPWFYLRQWVEQGADGKDAQMKAYYPALKYQPRMKTLRIDSVPVLWDAPVRHVKVNASQNWKFGIGDSYAAIPWALSHKGFLEDWALLMKALAKIAFVSSSKTAAASQSKRAALQGLANVPAGSSVSMSDDQKIEAMPKSGATLDSESSRPLATMAATAMGIPVTIALADPGQTGARATAETLDLPTRLTFQARQQLHAEVIRDSVGYAIEQAVIAPQGPLRRLGTAVRDDDRLKVEFTDPAAATVEVTFPGLDEVDVKVLIDAIVAADGMPDVPKLPLIRLALQVLKIPDVDEWIEKITDDDGNLLDTDTTAGDVATKAFRDGQDPAAALK
ncbi:hypothetical protein [Pseudarthrobacter polychromogenes]|uniref:SPP1 Gp6-like portal protein n=1 Tax=Pseudarthrobacter polychromogenes TaxID=1676 RepID=A0ABQ1X9A7_9MICC|nr:hypothetical protein [Pseudarthrobacter polychromogenes]GGG83702.1 hypothetical protein GCM10011577_01420 [Pseudarthrobacter polychromogenes]